MSSDRLNQAIAMAKSGNKAQARVLLEALLEEEPNNETAWLWMTDVVASDFEKRMCLERVLTINPKNLPAKEGLRRLAPQPPPLSTPMANSPEPLQNSVGSLGAAAAGALGPTPKAESINSPAPSAAVLSSPSARTSSATGRVPAKKTNDTTMAIVLGVLMTLGICVCIGLMAALASGRKADQTGSALEVSSNNPAQETPSASGAATASNLTPASRPTVPFTATPKGNSDIKRTARTDVSYDSLARNTESFVGQTVYYRGQVDQVVEAQGLRVVLRISVTEDKYGIWNDIVWVNYEGPRVLEDDIVNLWGRVKGRREYTSILNKPVVIPEIDALILEVETSDKPGGGVTRTATPLPTPVQVGQKAVVEGIGLTVLSVSKSNQPAQYMKADAGNTYVVVEVMIENVNSDNCSYNPYYFKIKDSAGVEYTEGGFGLDAALQSGKLGRGEKVRGKVAFEVKQSAQGFVLTYSPSLFSGSALIRVNLGK